MKTRNLISIMAVVVMMITSITAYGQNERNRVALAGSSVMVSDDASNWGLEVGGKLVVKKDYKSFGSKDGKFFVVEAKDGKMGICNDKGTFLFPCKYVKTSVSGSYIVIYETAGKPKFYKQDNPTVEVKPTEMSESSLMDEVDKKAPAGTVINTTTTVHKNAEEVAKKMSAEAPYGAFEFRTNSKGKQELLVDGKVIFTAASFELVSNVSFYKKTNCWFFIVTDYPRTSAYQEYGVLGVSMYSKDGKKVVEDMLSIPIEYRFISLHEGSVMKCRTWNGGEKYFDWLGEPFDITKKGGK